MGDYTFPEVRFNTVSGAAKDLITKMLVVNPDQRYSAKDVLEHPWMRLPVFCAPPNSNDCSSCSVNGANSINEEYLNDVYVIVISFLSLIVLTKYSLSLSLSVKLTVILVVI